MLSTLLFITARVLTSTPTVQDRRGPEREANSALERAIFPQWNSAVLCCMMSDEPDHGTTAGQSGAEVDGDGDNDCT